jgi:hypothetical protein
MSPEVNNDDRYMYYIINDYMDRHVCTMHRFRMVKQVVESSLTGNIEHKSQG